MKSVTKEMTIDCAHMLSNYSGKCNNLHGHTYKIRVSIITENLIENGSSEDMIMDFNELKGIMQRHISDKLDHALIFSSEKYMEDAEQDLHRWAIEWNKKYVILPNKRTTAEDLASWIRSEIKTPIQKIIGDCKIAVEVWETPTSCAEEF